MLGALLTVCSAQSPKKRPKLVTEEQEEQEKEEELYELTRDKQLVFRRFPPAGALEDSIGSTN